MIDEQCVLLLAILLIDLLIAGHLNKKNAQPLVQSFIIGGDPDDKDNSHALGKTLGLGKAAEKVTNKLGIDTRTKEEKRKDMLEASKQKTKQWRKDNPDEAALRDKSLSDPSNKYLDQGSQMYTGPKGLVLLPGNKLPFGVSHADLPFYCDGTKRLTAGTMRELKPYCDMLQKKKEERGAKKHVKVKPYKQDDYHYNMHAKIINGSLVFDDEKHTRPGKPGEEKDEDNIPDYKSMKKTPDEWDRLFWRRYPKKKL